MGTELRKGIVVITGPTASGKSRLALDLAELFPVEIISADSMQVYRGMDIGTDKPSPDERRRVPHHLIDIKDPDEEWSVREFQERSRRAIEEIRARGRYPMIVGGTGFYIRALLRGFPLDDAGPDPIFREEMRRVAREKGTQYLHNMLKQVDPETAERVHPNDEKRIIRALEYYKATGKPISLRLKVSPKEATFDALVLGLRWSREELRQRIEARVHQQFKRGFVQEVRNLLEKGYSRDLPSMSGLGYREVTDFLYGLTTEEECKRLICRNTARFAKRQFTWFAREPDMVWIECGGGKPWEDVVDEARKLIEDNLGWKT
ncbi:MAG: tRNA (adenosine(37)-N6)-dimethylallyltransferase MiaA [Firmicutes bacterium]|nr:tRNA (adenosine(37)-N6)-dimethylallyltransferase MiaA [Candidatus Fermentithermobacillaceae bacterium]